MDLISYLRMGRLFSWLFGLLISYLVTWLVMSLKDHSRVLPLIISPGPLPATVLSATVFGNITT
jgi:hypothetical protein